jgi:putative adhesin
MPIMRRRAPLPLSLGMGAWAVLAALAAAACGSASSTTVRHTATTTTQAGSPVIRVDVQNDNGDIAFRPQSRGTVTRTEAWNSVRPSYTQSLRSGTLTIRTQCPTNVPRNQCSVRLVIAVPPTVDINATTTNGNVRAAGFQSKTMAANSSNGEVTVSLDAQPASLSLETINGDITATASGKVRGAQSTVIAKSTDGDVNVSLKRAPTTLSLATNTGDIDATMPPGSYRLTTHTVSGDVSVSGVRNDPTASDAVSAQTVSGDITLAGG